MKGETTVLTKGCMPLVALWFVVIVILGAFGLPASCQHWRFFVAVVCGIVLAWIVAVVGGSVVAAFIASSVVGLLVLAAWDFSRVAYIWVTVFIVSAMISIFASNEEL